MKKDNDVPGREAWGKLPDDDLDMQAAYKDFFGKSNSNMQEKFANYPIEMADSLRWMPIVPFRYYIKGFTQFLFSGKSHGPDAADAANSFLNLIAEKLINQPNCVAPVMDEILPVVHHLADNQEAFNADLDIYGDFREKKKTIDELWASYDAMR